LGDGKVLPVAPLWSHFQHTLFPRAYKEWIGYDQEMLHLYDCCLRLDATLPELDYVETNSQGADDEVRTFKDDEKPVFYSIEELYRWVDDIWSVK